eukprot:gene2318-2668_t
MRRNTEPECEVVDEQPEPTGEISQLDEENQREQQDSRYPRRKSRLPTHLNDYVTESDDISCTVDFYYSMTLDEIPKTYAEAFFIVIREDCSLEGADFDAVLDLIEDDLLVQNNIIDLEIDEGILEEIREQLGGANNHKEQCNSVPVEINPEKHGLHLEPCYKRLILILSSEKGRSVLESRSDSRQSCDVRPKRSKSSEESHSRGIYPKECNFCHKYRNKRKQQHFYPITIATEQAANTLKQAAEENEDQHLFFEIKDIDLIAKEFRYHESCYKNFTRKGKKSVKSTKGEEDARMYSPDGNFDAVVECIENKILIENQAVSMKVLHESSPNPAKIGERSSMEEATGDQFDNDGNVLDNNSDLLLFVFQTKPQTHLFSCYGNDVPTTRCAISLSFLVVKTNSLWQLELQNSCNIHL